MERPRKSYSLSQRASQSAQAPQSTANAQTKALAETTDAFTKHKAPPCNFWQKLTVSDFEAMALQ